MPRRRDPSKPPRVRQPRQKREPAQATPDDNGLWIIRSLTLHEAGKILNHDKERPYWLSIPHVKGDGVEPVAGFLPCTFLRTKSRVYYGFLLRQHREELMKRWPNARREYTERMDNIRR